MDTEFIKRPSCLRSFKAGLVSVRGGQRFLRLGVRRKRRRRCLVRLRLGRFVVCLGLYLRLCRLCLSRISSLGSLRSRLCRRDLLGDLGRLRRSGHRSSVGLRRRLVGCGFGGGRDFLGRDFLGLDFVCLNFGSGSLFGRGFVGDGFSGGVLGGEAIGGRFLNFRFRCCLGRCLGRRFRGDLSRCLLGGRGSLTLLLRGGLARGERGGSLILFRFLRRCRFRRRRRRGRRCRCFRRIGRLFLFGCLKGRFVLRVNLGLLRRCHLGFLLCGFARRLVLGC